MAAKKILVPYDFSRNELQNAVFQVLASAPGAFTVGQFYYDSGVGRPMFRGASGWLDLTARSNHTGTQPWNTLSSVPTTLGGYGITDATPSTHVGSGGSQHAAVVAGGANGFMLGSDKTKLDGIATGATANSADSYLLARANHTGTQSSSTISDFTATVTGFRLDQFAAPTVAVNLNGQKLTNVGTPSAATDGVNKGYVDQLSQGFQPKPSAMVATAAVLPSNTYNNGTAGSGATLTASANGVLTIDGYAVALGDIVLVKNEVTAANNGLYTVTTLGTAGVPYVLTRHPNMDSSTEFGGAIVAVENKGTTTANSLWLFNLPASITVGTTAVTTTQLNTPTNFTQGNGIQISGNTISAVAGAGVVVDGSGIRIDIVSIVRKYQATIGDGTTLNYPVTHNLGTSDVQVQVYDVSTLATVECDVIRTSTSVVTVSFAVAPTTGQFRVLVQG